MTLTCKRDFIFLRTTISQHYCVTTLQAVCNVFEEKGLFKLVCVIHLLGKIWKMFQKLITTQSMSKTNNELMTH